MSLVVVVLCNIYLAPCLFRHSFKYLLNFRSTVPNLSTALCLSQLLSTVSDRGGNPAAYREEIGEADMSLYLSPLIHSSNGL